MISFFKINDPYRLIAIFIIAFAIKLPFIINESGFNEMSHWLTIGEAMKNGSMYRDIFDPLAPLAAFFYWLVVLVFGKSVIALHVLGTLLLVVQAIIFNNLTIQNKVYEQNTYLPAFSFLILSLSHYGLSVFSPAQLGMTFVLLAYSRLLSHVEFRAKRDEQIMSIGLYLGVAVLFYLQFIVFLPIVLIILLVYTNTLRRRYIILVVNTFMPLLICFAYYWIANQDAGYAFVNLIDPALSISANFIANVTSNYTLYLSLIVFLLAGLFTMPQQRRLNNYQNRLTYLFFLTGVLSLFTIIFNYSEDLVLLALLVPVSAFFTTHFFFLIKRPIMDLIVSACFVLVALFINFDSNFKLLGLAKEVDEQVEIEPKLKDYIKDKRLMVLGDYPILYEESILATPFYNWSLARPILDDLEFYDNLVFIKESIDQYKPEIILDYEHRWTKIQEQIPELKEQFKFVRPFVWKRVEH